MIDRLVVPDGRKWVLDVGGGAGNMLHHLARYGTVVGVDNNAEPLGIARQRRYDVRQGTAEDLPFDAESLDLVSIAGHGRTLRR
jgi:ubiquinone/menaquinone biosynthesis C-methylase UbiE